MVFYTEMKKPRTKLNKYPQIHFEKRTVKLNTGTPTEEQFLHFVYIIGSVVALYYEQTFQLSTDDDIKIMEAQLFPASSTFLNLDME